MPTRELKPHKVTFLNSLDIPPCRRLCSPALYFVHQLSAELHLAKLFLPSSPHRNFLN